MTSKQIGPKKARTLEAARVTSQIKILSLAEMGTRLD